MISANELREKQFKDYEKEIAQEQQIIRISDELITDPHFLSELGSHQRKNDYTAVEHKIGRLLFKYLPPILNKLGVSNRKAWLKREAFTFTPYVKSELASALIQAVKEYWKAKFTKKGYSWEDCTNVNSIMLIW